MGAGAPGVHHALRHALAVEVGELLDEVEVVDRLRTLRADLGAELVVRDGLATVGGGVGVRLEVAHAAVCGMNGHVSCSSRWGVE